MFKSHRPFVLLSSIRRSVDGAIENEKNHGETNATPRETDTNNKLRSYIFDAAAAQIENVGTANLFQHIRQRSLVHFLMKVREGRNAHNKRTKREWYNGKSVDWCFQSAIYFRDCCTTDVRRHVYSSAARRSFGGQSCLTLTASYY